MDWIPRYYETVSDEFFRPGKVVVLYGARRVGKTMLVQRLLSDRREKIFFSTGEDADLVDILVSRKVETFRLFFQPYEIVCIDEAQYIPQVGYSIKQLVDLFPQKRFLITGSSSFNIAQKASEPLTGRSVVKTLYPLSMGELRYRWDPLDLFRMLEIFLLYGMYPEVFALPEVPQKIEYLVNLRNSYLFKDILILDQVKSSQKLQSLVKLLALQIGNEVSLNEIAVTVGLSKNTVERYIDLLEKAFVIKKVPAFARNLRKEIAKSAKYYFWDTGVRNAVIGNFNRLDLRADLGALWENFVVMELVKKHEYAGSFAQFYFWRTYDQKELDLVMESGGNLQGYEIKWQTQRAKIPELWKNTYGPAEVITKERLLELVG